MQNSLQCIMDDNIIGSVQPKHFTFVWEINNFRNKCFKVGEFIESPFFTAGEISSNSIKWKIILYPSAVSDSPDKDYLSIFLACILGGNISECEVSCTFCCLNSSLDELCSSPVKYNTRRMRWGYSNFMSKEALQKHLSLLENDTLKIECSITNICFKNGLNTSSTELIESLDTLFLSDCFSDVTIEIDNKHLKAHKNILATRSEVFSAMFKHNTSETNENVIRITDISYEAMQEVLRFIYCGKVKNLQIYKEDLLAAANKYNLITLKKICELSIWNNVNASNACEILIFSELYHCDGLKSKTISLIAKNLKEVMASSGFKQLVDSNPKFLAEILQEVAEN